MQQIFTPYLFNKWVPYLQAITDEATDVYNDNVVTLSDSVPEQVLFYFARLLQRNLMNVVQLTRTLGVYISCS